MRQVFKDNAMKYIESERFIHDYLLTDCGKLVEKLYDFWKDEHCIQASLLLFPGDYVLDDVGKPINGVISMKLDGQPDHRRTILQAVERTKAYAFFYVRTEGKEVHALLESPHGTCEWTLPISRSADVEVLGTARKRIDSVGLNLLWSTNQGRS